MQTRARTYTQWHSHKETQREGGREKKKAAHMQHRRRYCIIDIVASAKENTHETLETINNWSLTSPTIASRTTDQGKKSSCQDPSVSKAKLDEETKTTPKSKYFLQSSTYPQLKPDFSNDCITNNWSRKKIIMSGSVSFQSKVGWRNKNNA